MSEVNIASGAATLFARLAALRETQAVPVVIAGHSVAQGIDATRWPYKFNERLQRAYPRANGQLNAVRTLSSVASSGLPSGTTGALVVNAAVGGTGTPTYLTEESRAKIMRLKPALIIHADIPANDFGGKVPPSVTKSSLIFQLGDLIAKANPAFPFQQIVFGGYFPLITDNIASVSAYRTAVREAVEQFPGKVIYYDTFEDWLRLGIGNGSTGPEDPLDFVDTDRLHLNSKGQAVIADMMARLFQLPDGASAQIAQVPADIITSQLNELTQGQAFAQVLEATGTTPISWALNSGTLPAGLTLSAGGVLSGTPTASGAYSFVVKATNSATDTQSFSGTVKAPVSTSPVAPSITAIQLVEELRGNVPFYYQLKATGTTPITWAVASGALPAGLSLSTTGEITGTPSTTAATPFSVTIRATNSVGSTTYAWSGTVAARESIGYLTPILSDFFSGGGTNLNGRVFPDAEGELAGTAWFVGAGTWTVDSNGVTPQLSGPAAALVNYKTQPATVIQLSSYLTRWVSGTSFSIELFRSTSGSGALLFGINSSGQLALSTSSGTVLATLPYTAQDIVGEVLTLAYSFETKKASAAVSGFSGGVTVNYTLPSTAGTQAGYSKASTADISFGGFELSVR